MINRSGGRCIVQAVVLTTMLGVAALHTRGATVKRADDTTVAGPLVALEDGAVVLNASADGKPPQRTSIPLEDVVEMAVDAAVDVPPPPADANTPKPATVPQKKGHNYTPLFDGKTLTNWKGEDGIWSVQDGAITGTATENVLTNRTTFLLYTGGQFSDFELHYRFKITGGLRNSSGVQFRSQAFDPGAGYEQVNGLQQDLGAEPGLTGGIVDSLRGAGSEPVKALPGERVVYSAEGTREVSSLGKTAEQLAAMIKDGDWNDAIIVAKGNRVVSLINGQVFADVTNNHPAGAKAGAIGVQLSRRRVMTVQLKDIRLRNLRGNDKPDVPGLDWDRPPSQVAESDATGSSGPAAPSTTVGPEWQIRIVGGERIRGELVTWDEKELKLKTAHGELAVPVRKLREVWHASQDEIKKARVAAESAGQSGRSTTEDVAFARKDNQIVPVAGLVLGVDSGALQFRFRDEQRRITLDKLVGVMLTDVEDAEPDEPLQQSLVLRSGDVICGQWTALDKGIITLSTPWAPPMDIPVKDVERITTKNGRLVYLSSMPPAQVEQVPYFDRLMPFRTDKSLAGGPIKLSTGEHAKGLSVHSRTVLHYDISRRFETFKAKVGFQQPEGKLGRATIRVLADQKVLHEIPDARGDQPPVDLDLPVMGVSRLTLEVDFGADQDVGDRVVWADARLLRAAPVR